MADLRFAQLDDFVELTLEKYERDRWTDISLALQKYFATKYMLGKGKVTYDGGEQLQWQVQVANAGNAVVSGLFDTDTANIVNVVTNAKVPWTFQKVHFAYEEREDAFQSGPERIISVVRMRQHVAMNDFADLIETLFWSTPSDATTQGELLKPYGVPYWIVPNATKGFNGAAPSGHTTVGGINPSTYTNWKNFTGRYTDISRRDLVRLMREAIKKCQFEPPDPHPTVADQSFQYAICTTFDVDHRLDELAEEQNDNLGNDLASKDGIAVVRRFPKYWIPKLDSLSGGAAYGTNPVYGLPMHSFKACFKTGWYMRRSKPQPAPWSHNSRVVWWDNQVNFKLSDRRNAFVLDQNT